MILEFIIEPEAFQDLDQRGNWGSFLASLETFWERHGVLVVPDDFDESLERSGLNISCINEWRTFVTGVPKRTVSKQNCTIDWAKVHTWNDIKEHQGQFDLALLQQPNVARVRSISTGNQYCLHDPSGDVPIEIAQGDHVLFTCQSREVQNLGSSTVEPTETPTQIWQERLRGHVKHSTSVLLVDIYAADQWKGLQTFLEKLVTDGREWGQNLQTVHLYSAYGSFSGQGPGTAAFIKKRLLEEANRLSDMVDSAAPSLRIQVHLLHRNNMPNDRWLRFDENIVGLGHGLEMFEPGRNQAFGFNLSSRDRGRQKGEEDLQSICKSHGDSEGVRNGPFSVSVCTRPRR